MISEHYNLVLGQIKMEYEARKKGNPESIRTNSELDSEEKGRKWACYLCIKPTWEKRQFFEDENGMKVCLHEKCLEELVKKPGLTDLGYFSNKNLL